MATSLERSASEDDIMETATLNANGNSTQGNNSKERENITYETDASTGREKLLTSNKGLTSNISGANTSNRRGDVDRTLTQSMVHYKWQFLAIRRRELKPMLLHESERSFVSEEECMNDAFMVYPKIDIICSYDLLMCIKEIRYEVPFSSLESRMSTFSNWPPSMPISGRRMAKAGFYYEGCSDKVTCFHCKVTLMKWQINEDPWEEHSKHSPFCKFLRDEYVRPSVPGIRYEHDSPWK